MSGKLWNFVTKYFLNSQKIFEFPCNPILGAPFVSFSCNIKKFLQHFSIKRQWNAHARRFIKNQIEKIPNKIQFALYLQNNQIKTLSSCDPIYVATKLHQLWMQNKIKIKTIKQSKQENVFPYKVCNCTKANKFSPSF